MAIDNGSVQRLCHANVVRAGAATLVESDGADIVAEDVKDVLATFTLARPLLDVVHPRPFHAPPLRLARDDEDIDGSSGMASDVIGIRVDRSKRPNLDLLWRGFSRHRMFPLQRSGQAVSRQRLCP